MLEKFSFYKNLLFPLRKYSEKSHLKNGWLQGGILSVYQMCKLLVGLVFLVILALELFFNRLRNGWLHTVRVGFVGFRVGFEWVVVWSVFLVEKAK